MPTDATETTFKNETAEGLVLVDFWAEWCGPCKMLTPTLERVENELDGQLKVVKVNVDEESELARNFTVMSIPTMIVFQDGLPVKTIVGVKPKTTILKELEDYL